MNYSAQSIGFCLFPPILIFSPFEFFKQKPKKTNNGGNFFDRLEVSTKMLDLLLDQSGIANRHVNHSPSDWFRA